MFAKLVKRYSKLTTLARVWPNKFLVLRGKVSDKSGSVGGKIEIKDRLTIKKICTAAKISKSGLNMRTRKMPDKNRMKLYVK